VVSSRACLGSFFLFGKEIETRFTKRLVLDIIEKIEILLGKPYILDYSVIPAVFNA
jgi:hypothetical protein